MKKHKAIAVYSSGGEIVEYRQVCSVNEKSFRRQLRRAVIGMVKTHYKEADGIPENVDPKRWTQEDWTEIADEIIDGCEAYSGSVLKGEGFVQVLFL